MSLPLSHTLSLSVWPLFATFMICPNSSSSSSHGEREVSAQSEVASFDASISRIRSCSHENQLKTRTACRGGTGRDGRWAWLEQRFGSSCAVNAGSEHFAIDATAARINICISTGFHLFFTCFVVVVVLLLFHLICKFLL